MARRQKRPTMADYRRGASVQTIIQADTMQARCEGRCEALGVPGLFTYLQMDLNARHEGYPFPDQRLGFWDRVYNQLTAAS